MASQADPSSMLSISFQLFQPVSPSTTENALSARLGNLTFPKRKPLPTPNYIALTSRGVVPHLAQDMMRDQTSIGSVYTALEDYIERHASSSPVLAFPCKSNESPLRRFIALQESALLILGPRRFPRIPCPASNTNTAISILTSVGFGSLEVEDFISTVVKLRPDIILGMGDIVFPGDGKNAVVSVKRKEKMAERTFTWVRELIRNLRENQEENTPQTVLFAPILPIEAELQQDYLSQLYDNNAWKGAVRGLVLYDIPSVEAVPQQLHNLPRLSVAGPTTPQAILRAISLGIDLFTLPFVTEATDSGIAFSFIFPPPSFTPTSKPPLGIDMWLPIHSKDPSPLLQGCTCYACSSHHKAYIHHLLSAKEMLAWVLLQVHNHHVIEGFFSATRESIARDSFTQDTHRFEKTYETDLPTKTGQGPRIRGYQHHVPHSTPKRANLSAYRKFTETSASTAHDALLLLPPEEKESEWPIADLPAKELEEVGFAKVVDG